MNFKKIYIYFWTITLIVILIGIIFNDPVTVIDLNANDTYFVISYLHVSILIGGIYFLLGIPYWLLEKFKRNFSKKFTLFHVFITIGSILSYWVVFLFLRIFFTEKELIFSDYYNLTSRMLIIIMCLNLIIQPIFIINFIIILSKKKIAFR